MNKIDDNNNKIQINDLQDIVRRKIGRPPFIRTDKTKFKKEKKIQLFILINSKFNI